MSDPMNNPYAPPAALSAAGDSHGPWGLSRSSYGGERRSVALLVFYCLLTFGIYPSVWYLRRAPFLDSLAAQKKVGALPWVSLALILALIALSAAGAKEGAQLVQVAAGLVSLLLAFRVAAILRSDFTRSGRGIDISTLGVFFFGCLYLQHAMNQAADVPPIRPKDSGLPPR
jgi:hypothetical protein